MKIKEITKYLNEIAPLALQEQYDNGGFLVGSENQEINSALITRWLVAKKVIISSVNIGKIVVAIVLTREYSPDDHFSNCV